MRYLILLFSIAVFAQAPTVTCTGTDALGQPRGANYIGPYSLQVNCTSSATNYYSRIEYGTSAGVYTNRTQTVGTGFTTQILMYMGGLTPSTTYYARAVSQPNINNLTDVGYSAEFSFTTAAEDNALPTLPTEWVPSAVDTTGYTVVLLKRCVTGFPCADGAVPSLGITNEEDLRSMLPKAQYGTVFRFPRALDVNVNQDTLDGNNGYTLPALPVQAGKTGIDDPTHQWIVFETEGCNGSSYFPPYGSRIDDSFVPSLAVLRSTLFTTIHPQHFGSYNSATHHFWFQCLNLEFPTGAATDVVNPTAAREAISVVRGITPTLQLKYFVFDRLYINGTGGTKRQYAVLTSGAQNTAIIGCHLVASIWRISSWPTGTPSVGGTGNRTLTIPSGTTYKIKSTDAAQGCSGGASAVVTAAGLGNTGNWAFTLGASGCKFYYDTRNISSVSCTNCTAVGAASDPLTVLPSNEYTFTQGTSTTAAVLSISNTNNSPDSLGAPIGTGGGSTTLSFGIQVGEYNAGPFSIENTYVQVAGLGFYVDGFNGGREYNVSDGTTRRSWFNKPPSWQWNNASTNGYRYDNRQHWEIKRGERWLVQGNVFTGEISARNEGASIFLSGRGTYEGRIGSQIQNVTIRSNTIAHGPAGYDCTQNSGRPLDPVPAGDILIENNLLYALNFWEHNTNTGFTPLNQSYYTAYSACQDVYIRNNTHGVSKGLAPVLSLIGGDDLRGARHRFINNIYYYSQGDTGCSRFGVVNDSTPVNPWYPSLPASSGVTVAQQWDDYFARVGNGTVTATNVTTENVMIGGVCSVNQNNITDLSQATVNTMEAGFKSGNYWPAGNTMAERENAAGLTSPSTYNFRLLPTSPYYRGSIDKISPIGANLTTLQYEQGVVDNISVVSSDTSITAYYLAPDTRACVLDVSSNGGTTWTRASDGGGNQYRINSVTGLSPSTTYSWRLICYYLQVNDGRQWDTWPSDQITTGSINTKASNSLTIAVKYVLPPIAGAAKARFTVTMSNGATSVTTCTSSPCSVPFTRSAVSYVLDFLSAADVVLVRGDRMQPPTQ